jgi:hypothetical protein
MKDLAALRLRDTKVTKDGIAKATHLRTVDEVVLSGRRFRSAIAETHKL